MSVNAASFPSMLVPSSRLATKEYSSPGCGSLYSEMDGSHRFLPRHRVPSKVGRQECVSGRLSVWIR
eukprot:7391484-Pyramimonas_sp.AAC.1